MAKLLNLELSADRASGGQPPPLQSSPGEIQPGADFDLNQAIQDALERGIDFRLPPGFAVELSIDEFTQWLADQSFSPVNLSSMVTGTSVAITDLTVSTTGRFDIALSVEFETGLIPGDFGDFLDIDRLSLRLAYTP